MATAIEIHKADEESKEVRYPGVVTTTDGKDIPMKASTVCVHSDTPGIVAVATELRRALRA